MIYLLFFSIYSDYFENLQNWKDLKLRKKVSTHLITADVVFGYGAY